LEATSKYGEVARIETSTDDNSFSVVKKLAKP